MTFDLFDVFERPRMETPAPSAPRSRSSEDAADAVSNPLRAKSHKKIMWALVTATAERPRSMAEIRDRTGLAINVICARLSELRPLWVQQHERACISHAKPSLRVDGFSLTSAGQERIQAALRKPGAPTP
jgi:hypothetical protein